MMLSWLLILVVIAGGIYWWSRRGGYWGQGQVDDPEEILRKRFARGEIDKEALQRRLDELRRSRT